MISSFRNFAKTKFAGLLVFLMIIPFVFWGMGSMFSSGNSNNLAKINKSNISTGDFFLYLDEINIAGQTIKNNLEKNIIEELLSNLISTKLLELEIRDFYFSITEKTILKKIKKNKNFLDNDNNFKRLKYEKFLLENNISAPLFEQRLKKRELQKNLFDYIGAGTVSPQFLIKKLFEEENKKLNIEFINLKNFYKKKDDINKNDLKDFIDENRDQLKVEYIDFNYVLINPKNLVGVDEFNQTFFDKIDQIEVDISNEVNFKTIVDNLNLNSIKISNFKFSLDKNEIEKKIFKLRNNKFDIFEFENNYILYEVKNVYQKEPDINEKQTIIELTELISQKNKFDYNRELLNKINNKKFNEKDFLNMGQDNIKSIKLNSVKDNKKFNIESVEVLYSMPINSLTLINDEKNDIYLTRIVNFEKLIVNDNDETFKTYINKHNTNNKNSILQSYDLYLNNKYKINLNQKAIERIKNSF